MKILTKEDSQVVMDFQKHICLQAYVKLTIVMGIILVCGILLLCLKYYSLGSFFISFSLVMEIIFPIVFAFSNKRINKSNSLMMSDKQVEFEFLENDFIIKAYHDNQLINQATFLYHHIYKIDETKTYYFIYIANNQALCIDKVDMSGDDSNKLRGILQSNCLKYKICKF